MKKINLINQKFGKLTVISSAPSNKRGQAMWVCQCECGNKIIALGNSLRNGHSKSCGCTRNEKIRKLNLSHNMSNTRIYKIWQDLKARCYNPNNKEYKNYGARGITVCSLWKDSFENFYNWAMANGYNESLTIDRINVNGNYEPSNCRWADSYLQANNRRNTHYVSYNGEVDSLENMCRKLNVNSKIIRYRMNYKKISFQQAVDNFSNTSPYKEYWKK